MKLSAKDLIKILGSVDEDSDVIFHVDDDENRTYCVDYAKIEEGVRDETDMTIHIMLGYCGSYNPGEG